MKLFQGNNDSSNKAGRNNSALFVLAGFALLYTVYQILTDSEARGTVSPLMYWASIVVFTAGGLFAFWQAYCTDKASREYAAKQKALEAEKEQAAKDEAREQESAEAAALPEMDEAAEVVKDADSEAQG